MSRPKNKSGKGKKASSKRRSALRIQKPGKSNVPRPKKRWPKIALSVVVNILALWGGVLTIWVVYYPRVSVDPASALDPNNPAFTPFVVHNQGYWSIHDVKFSCTMKYIKYPGKIVAVAQKEYENSFSDPKQIVDVIAAGEKYTELLPLTGMEHNRIENADIAIVLSFKPINWLPWRRETRHRFVSTQGKDRLWHWLPQPINE
jgi:hypothetical protein